jgi:hypothetical protein
LAFVNVDQVGQFIGEFYRATRGVHITITHEQGRTLRDEVVEQVPEEHRAE